MTFTPTIAGAIPIEAHPLNYYGPGNPNAYRDPVGKVIPCTPRALFFHTPEEDADDYEGTPAWFRNPDAHGSTRWYADNDGDLFAMVPEPWGAIANGLDGKPRPAWAPAGISLNLLSDNIEIEGRAHSLQRTITGKQFATCVDWAVDRCVRFEIPPDRAHLCGHYEVSVQRTDPGPWFLTPASGFIEEVTARVTEFERKLKELGQYIIEDRLAIGRVSKGLDAHTALAEAILPPLAAGHAGVAEKRLRDIYGISGKPYPYPCRAGNRPRGPGATLPPPRSPSACRRSGSRTPSPI